MKLFLLFASLIPFYSLGQNLVPNGSFETHNNCPDYFNQVKYATGWSTCKEHNDKIHATDYCNACGSCSNGCFKVPSNVWGYQNAYSGNGYMIQATTAPNLYTDYRENIFCALSQPLIIGHTYCLSFKVSKSDITQTATNKIGLKLTRDSIFPVNNSAQLFSTNVITDTSQWITISGIFKADSAYKYVAIGNFFTDANTTISKVCNSCPRPETEYYLDDIFVGEMNVSPKDTSVCNGDTVQLNTSGNNFYSYSWGPAAGLSCTNCEMPIATPSESSTYSVTITSNSGCSVTDSITVSIFSGSLNRVDTAICSGHSIQLGINEKTIHATWFPGTDLSDSTIANPIASPTTSTTYTVTVTLGSGCTASGIVDITVNPGWNAGSISSIKDTICANTIAHLTVIGNSGGLVWQSSHNPTSGFTTISGTTSVSYSPILAVSTYYRVIVGTGPCADTSAIFKMNVIPAPLAKFKWVTNGQEITFNSDSSLGAVFYSWDFDDGSSSSSPNPTHTFDSVKTYHVCLTITNHSNCNFTLCQYVTTYPTGIDIISNDSNLSIYPVPVISYLYINSNSNIHEIEKIELFDLLGRKVYSTGDITQNPQQLDLSSLETGAYILKIITSKGNFIYKIIKDK